MPPICQTVLVVEDEASIAETIMYALQTEGFSPVWKTNGHEALAALKQQPVALVVLDVGSVQGARVGMPFIVLRGDRVIAWARVVEVRQKICGALIEKTEGNVAVKAGDAASVTKS